MVMRFDPFREADRLAQELTGRMSDTSGTMPMDAYRRGDEVIVHFDLPGVMADSIELTVEQNTLTVRAERYWEQEPDDQLLARERRQGQFTRQLMLGDHLDTDKVQAHHEDGVLTLKIPVVPAAQPKKIQITGGGGAHDAIDIGSDAGSEGDS
jgi:HSP20 family protein